MMSINEHGVVSKMKTKKSLFYFVSVCSLFGFIISLLLFIQPLHTQSAGDLMITEIMYNTISDSDWIEVMNTSRSLITMTDIQIQINGGTERTTAVHDQTSATLAANDIAVIVRDAAAFAAAHNTYPTNKIYTNTALNLPSRNNSTITLKKSDGTEIDSVIYNINELARRRGVSLHKTLGNVFTPAPATPGLVAINPVSDQSPNIVGISIATSVTDGTDKGDTVFVDEDDVITLYVLEQDGAQSPNDVMLTIGQNKRTVTLTTSSDAGKVVRSGTYTVQSNEEDGVVRYTITGITDSLGNRTTKIGIVTHNGKPVRVDNTAPTVTSEITPTGSATRKTAVFTITDTNIPSTIKYKISDTSCGTKTPYTASVEDEKESTVQNGEARVIFSSIGSNNKYVCVKVEDEAGHITYAVSDQISGITATSARITELMYAPNGGADLEWIEVTNKGTTTVTLADFGVIDGGDTKGIEHVAGSQTLVAGEIAIITRNAGEFRIAYPGYFGPLFRSSFNLNDTGDTIGLQLSSTEAVVDSITYTKTNGAYKNGKTLHVDNNGDIFEGDPSLGTITERGEDPGMPATLLNEPSYPKDVLAKIEQFDNETTIEGQNLFFTNQDSSTVIFTLKDAETEYTESNIGDYLTVRNSASNASGYRVERTSVESISDDAVRITYTVYFSATNDNTPADNRITVYPELTNERKQVSSKRSSVTIVRNTTAPTLQNGTNATVLGFAGGENIIIPVTVSNIALGDWIRPVYAGSCGDGLSSYIAKNGGHGVYYDLAIGTYTSCTLSATDSAGNNANILTLPKILVGQTE